MDRHILSNHRESGTQEFGEGAGVHEDEDGSALIEGIVDGRKPGRCLRGDVEVTGGFEILVDRARPFEAILVQLLEVRVTHGQRFVAAEDGSNRFGVTDCRGEPHSLKVVFRNATQSLETDR